MKGGKPLDNSTSPLVSTPTLLTILNTRTDENTNSVQPELLHLEEVDIIHESPDREEEQTSVSTCQEVQLEHPDHAKPITIRNKNSQKLPKLSHQNK